MEGNTEPVSKIRKLADGRYMCDADGTTFSSERFAQRHVRLLAEQQGAPSAEGESGDQEDATDVEDVIGFYAQLRTVVLDQNVVEEKARLEFAHRMETSVSNLPKLPPLPEETNKDEVPKPKASVEDAAALINSRADSPPAALLADIVANSKAAKSASIKRRHRELSRYDERLTRLLGSMHKPVKNVADTST